MERKLKKEVKTIILLLLVLIGAIIALNYTSKDDREAIDACVKETNNRAFCEREYNGTH